MVEYKKSNNGINLVRLGSDYGGYWIPTKFNYGVVYDCGVGEDTSFAHDLYYHFPYTEIHLFDPTERAIKHLESVKKILSFPMVSTLYWDI